MEPTVGRGAKEEEKQKSDSDKDEEEEGSGDDQNDEIDEDIRKVRFFPDFDGTEDSQQFSRREQEEDYKNEHYWKLPENVRHAIDLAKQKSQHTDFWYRLQTLNDKIFVFRNMFYSKAPAYQQAFYEKKRKEMEEKLRLEKIEYEKKMQAILKKQKRRMRRQAQEDWRTTMGDGKSKAITTTQMIEQFKAKQKKLDQRLKAHEVRNNNDDLRASSLTYNRNRDRKYSFSMMHTGNFKEKTAGSDRGTTHANTTATTPVAGPASRMKRPAMLQTSNVIQEADQNDEMTPMPKDLLQSKALTNKFESKAQRRVVPTTLTTPEYNRLPTIDSSVLQEQSAKAPPKISEITKVAKVKVHTKSNLSFQEPKKKHSAKLDKAKRNGHHDKLN